MVQVEVRKPFMALHMLFALSMMSSAALAQLPDATWAESVAMTVGAASENHAGSNDYLPEPQSGAMSASNAELSGSVTFAMPGPPNATSTATASIQDGIEVGVSSICLINFGFVVREDVAPPVSVSLVPVLIHARGSASTTAPDALLPEARAEVIVISASVPPFSWEATASYSTPSEEFDDTIDVPLRPGDMNLVTLIAQATASADYLQSDASGVSTARVNPTTIEVANRLIPGTTSNYRNYFVIEFSPGYWALGQPQSVEPTTWGRIKAAYR